jgi:subtilisin family serine protease
MRTTSRRAAAVALGAALLAAAPPAAKAAPVAPGLAREVEARGPLGEVPIIVEVAGRLDPAAFAVRDRRLRDGRLAAALRANAARTLPPLRRAVEALGARDVKELWLLNALAATVPAGAVASLAAEPGVRSVRLDAAIQAPETLQAAAAAPQWNVAAIRAPALWSAGETGTGAVVAGLDTGVDAAHPDLVGTWRGGPGGWYDPFGQHASPYDANGHGTQTMGLVVGGSASGTAIGVAPGAQWIAARIFDDAGRGTLSNVHLALQWALDPDGDPATLDAPDVVNGSWTITGDPVGACDLEFQPDVLALEAAGIASVFAAGNDGPADATSDSPANNPGVLSAGAVDAASTVASFSSRGPSSCDGSIFPTVVAPGVDVWTSDLSFGGFPSYAAVSGTSFAAPHVAGALALLAAARPAASVAELGAALVQGAADLGAVGADDTYGHGLADAEAALALLGPGADRPPTITSSPVTTATEGALYVYQVSATDPEGTAVTFSLDTAPAGMAIAADGGFVTWTPDATQVGASAVAVRATDGAGLASTQSFTVTVAPANRAPVAADDAFTAPYRKSTSYAPRVLAVLANDRDPDGSLAAGSVRIRTAPTKGGTATVNADGTVSYVPKVRFRGTEAFTYDVRDDAGATSNVATATVTVQ